MANLDPYSSAPTDVVTAISPPIITTSYSGFPLKKITTSTNTTTKTKTTLSVQATVSLVRFGGLPRFLVLQDAPAGHRYYKKTAFAASTVGEVPEHISRQWHHLDADLPDSVSVRVYRSRPDLMRVAVYGGVKTPYHNFVYVLDVFLPPDFPVCPPEVRFAFRGFHVSPNVLRYGHVRLDILNTGIGNTWRKNETSLVEVLVDIRDLFHDSRPYFQDPFLARWRGSPSRESVADCYAEKVYIQSCKMTLRLLEDTPADSREIVVAHFRERAVDILADLRRYSMADIGAMVEICGGIVLRVTGKFKADALHLYGRMLEFMYTRYRDLIHPIIYDRARVVRV